MYISNRRSGGEEEEEKDLSQLLVPKKLLEQYDNGSD